MVEKELSTMLYFPLLCQKWRRAAGKGLLPCRCSPCLHFRTPGYLQLLEAGEALPRPGALALRGRVNPSTGTIGSSPCTRRPFLSRGRVCLSPPTCFAGKRTFPGEITYLHWEEPFVARLSYCSLKKWPFFPRSPKNKAMQRNTNGTAMTRAVTCKPDLIYEISSYSTNLLWFPSELCAEILTRCFDNTFWKASDSRVS